MKGEMLSLEFEVLEFNGYLTCHRISGYEYTVESTFGGYGPVEKTYHLCRRRRWVRNRVVVKSPKVEEEQVKCQVTR